MIKIKLDPRLSAVASLVRKGSRVADIGTDHAYLLCYLIQNGICPDGIASDLRKGPLENAKQTINECEISDKVEIILSDGLKNIKEDSADDVVIAGMGGMLISEIIENAKWLYKHNIQIIAQPMTHAEFLRKFLIENGFEIIEERTATDGKRLYCAISAHFTGNIEYKEESYYYLGELLQNRDNITDRYIEKLIDTLEKKYSAQKKAGLAEAEKLGVLIEDIKMKVSEA